MKKKREPDEIDLAVEEAARFALRNASTRPVHVVRKDGTIEVIPYVDLLKKLHRLEVLETAQADGEPKRKASTRVRCQRCGKSAPVRKRPGTPRKFCSRACANAASYARNRERIREQQAQYREANREKLAAKTAERYRRNPGAAKARAAKYHEANRERIREQQAQYREANRERKAAKSRERYEANRERIREQQAQYREAIRARDSARRKRDRIKRASLLKKRAG